MGDHDPARPRADLAGSWQANARAWTDAVRSGAIASRRLATDRAVLDAVLAQRPDRVLDLGCGEGWLARELAARGLRVVGIDASAPLIEAARAEPGAARFEVLGYAELVAAPQRLGERFDLVVANFALLDDALEPLLRALARGVLRPGGRLVVQTLHPHAVGGRYVDGWRVEDFAALRGDHGWTPMPWFFRTLGGWVEALVGSGFELLELREPLHPETWAVASLILVAGLTDQPRSARADGSTG
jgi:SAM-dependent methyltransferase